MTSHTAKTIEKKSEEEEEEEEKERTRRRRRKRRVDESSMLLNGDSKSVGILNECLDCFKYLQIVFITEFC